MPLGDRRAPPPRAASRSPRSSQTSGQTSSAPIAGWAPRGGACRSASTAAARARRRAPRAAAPAPPARVKTVRLWSGSEWRSSSATPRREGAPRAPRPSPGRGPRRRWGRRAARVTAQTQQLAVAHDAARRRARPSARSRRSRGGPAPGRCRRSRRRRRRRRARCRGSSRPRGSRRSAVAFSFVPMPSSATLVPSAPCAVSSSHQPLALGPPSRRSGGRPRP